MPNPKPEYLRQYLGLKDIPAEEWDEFFPNTGKPWTPSDIKYLIEWWGRDDVLSLSYALGRPPWNLQTIVCRLRKSGEVVPYQRNLKHLQSQQVESDEVVYQ